MANQTYEQFFKTIRPEQLGRDGRFLGPQSGTDYRAEGYTPQQWFDFNTMVNDPNAGGYDSVGETRTRMDSYAPVSADWTQYKPSNWLSSLTGGAPPLLVAAMGGLGAYASGAFGGAGAVGADLTGGAGMTDVLPGMGAGGTGAEVASPYALPGGTGTFGSGSALSTGNALATGGIGATGVAGTGALDAGLAVGGGAGLTASGALAGGSAGALSDAAVASAVGGGAGSGVAAWLKANPWAAQLGGAAIGALASRDAQQTQTASRDPWTPAQPYLLDNLKTNAAMQEHYRQSPFSNEQKQAYQGLLDTVANNKAVGAGLLSNANNFMQSRRGVMPAMQALPTGGTAPAIDWTQYANIGRK